MNALLLAVAALLLGAAACLLPAHNGLHAGIGVATPMPATALALSLAALPAVLGGAPLAAQVARVHPEGTLKTRRATVVRAHFIKALRRAHPAGLRGQRVVAVWACAISGRPFKGSSAIDRQFLERFRPARCVAGCPPHPRSFISGMLDLPGIES